MRGKKLLLDRLIFRMRRSPGNKEPVRQSRQEPVEKEEVHEDQTSRPRGVRRAGRDPGIRLRTRKLGVHRAGQSGRRLGLHLPHRRPHPRREGPRAGPDAGRRTCRAPSARSPYANVASKRHRRPEPDRRHLDRRHHADRPGQVSGRRRHDALAGDARRRCRHAAGQQGFEVRLARRRCSTRSRRTRRRSSSAAPPRSAAGTTCAS